MDILDRFIKKVIVDYNQYSLFQGGTTLFVKKFVSLVRNFCDEEGEALSGRIVIGRFHDFSYAVEWVLNVASMVCAQREQQFLRSLEEKTPENQKVLIDSRILNLNTEIRTYMERASYSKSGNELLEYTIGRSTGKVLVVSQMEDEAVGRLKEEQERSLRTMQEHLNTLPTKMAYSDRIPTKEQIEGWLTIDEFGLQNKLVDGRLPKFFEASIVDSCANRHS